MQGGCEFKESVDIWTVIDDFIEEENLFSEYSLKQILNIA